MTGYRSYGSLIYPIKQNGIFFQTVALSILLYGCTTWTLTKRTEKKLDENYARILRGVLNKFQKQLPTKTAAWRSLTSHLTNIQIRRKRHAEHCWRSKDELIGDDLQWTPIYGHASVDRPAKTYLHQLWAETGWILKDQPGMKDDRDRKRERERERERERGGGEFVLSARLDDDNDDGLLWMILFLSLPSLSLYIG